MNELMESIVNTVDGNTNGDGDDYGKGNGDSDSDGDGDCDGIVISDHVSEAGEETGELFSSIAFISAHFFMFFDYAECLTTLISQSSHNVFWKVGNDYKPETQLSDFIHFMVSVLI